VLASVLGEPPGAKQRGVEVRAFQAQPDAQLLGELAHAVAQGKLVIPVEHRLPLTQAREAFQVARKGGVGKVLLLP
jgi:NADPH:quinone reductase-like Zn-dependent oxidoreductase